MTFGKGDFKPADIAEKALKSFKALADAETRQKNAALQRLAALLEDNSDEIIKCNKDKINPFYVRG